MLAILRKPMCIWRLKVVEVWKSRNINNTSIDASSSQLFWAAAPQHVPAQSDAICDGNWWGLVFKSPSLSWSWKD